MCFSDASSSRLFSLTGLIVVQVVRFPEAVEAAVEELMPNRITDYLYDLSEKFNGFYTECHVSAVPWRIAHMLVCAASHLGAYGNILQTLCVVLTDCLCMALACILAYPA